MLPKKHYFRSFIGSFLSLVALSACNPVGGELAPAQNAQPAVAEATTKIIGTFSTISGTPYLRAPLIEVAERSSGFSLSSSTYSAPQASNYVYLNLETEQTQQLLPDNDAIILENIALPEPSSNDTSDWVIEWFLYRIVKEDSNDDDRFSEEDLQIIALSDAGGQGYTELIDGVNQLHGRALRDPQTLLVIYRKDNALWLSEIDLPQRAVVATTELPSFGDDVRLEP